MEKERHFNNVCNYIWTRASQLVEQAAYDILTKTTKTEDDPNTIIHPQSEESQKRNAGMMIWQKNYYFPLSRFHT